MRILSHRGYWKNNSEKNCEEAFSRSFNLGFGVETDVRDCNENLFISHDMPTENDMKLEFLLKLLSNRQLPLAINVKSDGIARPLRKAMDEADVKDWFVFDMSVPDMREHIKIGNPVFTRMSEVEQSPIWLESAKGVWLDAFEVQWFSRETIEALISANKQVCVVSPELHGRDYHYVWDMIAPIANEPGLMLCTDHPECAYDFFREFK